MPKWAFRHRLTMLRCRNGTGVIEFAIVAPVLFIMLISLVELGMMFAAWTTLEGATNLAARFTKTGYIDSNAPVQTLEGSFKHFVATTSYGILDATKIGFDIKAYETFADIVNPTKGTAGVGAGSDVVVYRITYPWELFTPVLRGLVGDQDGTMTLQAVVTVRNEPF